jgi:hypothetical protein
MLERKVTLWAVLRCVNCRMRRRFSSEEKERLRDVPFRVLANILGVSVWTAHRLCVGRS